MGSGSSIVFSGIAPHPPIMVPEVGGDSIAEVRGSISAMAEFARRVIDSKAETVVLVSPHAPLDPHAFVAYDSPQLYGDFRNFRSPSTRVEFQLDDELLKALVRQAGNDGYEVVGLGDYGLDHGTAVPLYFLGRNGWNGRVVALGYSFVSNDDHVAFGVSLTEAVNAVGRSVALVASGDLSHRLKPEAPAGYNPIAHRFDEEVVAAIDDDEPERIIDIDSDLRRLAGECGYRSMLVALGATKQLAKNCEVLNYEAPFGVGYLVAQLTGLQRKADEKMSAVITQATTPDDDLPALARKAVETFVLTGKQISTPEEAGLLAERAACFVSIKTHTGDLRGCIGTIEPVKQTLAEELISNAVNAATRDPRFLPVNADELSNLKYSVDVLAAPEPTTFDELDPAVYGVIVEDEARLRRGLLLPDIPGVETAAQQVDIAARKAGIPPGTPLKFHRFKVERFREAR
jgi:MEMO1 family protein